MKRKNGRVRYRPPRMTSATAATISKALAQPATPFSASPPCISSLPAAASSVEEPLPTASKGMMTSSGIAATSWNNRTAKLARPPSVRVSFFSASVCMTMAVEDRLRMIPIASASLPGSPICKPTKVMIAMVSETCSPPMPISLSRISQSMLGRISRPMRNSIRTTPNSAYSWTMTVSAPTIPSIGPIIMPATRNPSTEPRPTR